MDCIVEGIYHYVIFTYLHVNTVFTSTFVSQVPAPIRPIPLSTTIPGQPLGGSR